MPEKDKKKISTDEKSKNQHQQNPLIFQSKITKI